MRLFTLCVILILYGKTVSCSVRTWLPTTNILNKENWKPNEKECKGLIFPESTNYPMALDTLTISKIVFPVDGGMILNEGASITLDPRNETCISLKQPEKKSWVDPKNWNPLPNKAIPDLDRIPCDSDEVVFPKRSSYDVSFPVSIRRDRQFIFYIRRVLRLKITSSSGKITQERPSRYRRRKCKNSWDCICHSYFGSIDVCDYADVDAKPINCVDPVMPNGDCRPICGSYILLKTELRLNKIQKYLEDNSKNVDFYISRRFVPPILSQSINQYQITLVDKDNDNTGHYSNQLAKQLEALLNDVNSELYIRGGISVFSSGHPTNHTFFLDMILIVFGAFLGTVAVFGVIFVAYSGLPEKYNFEIKLPSMFFKKEFKPFVYAEFKNTEGGGLRLSRGSVGSLVTVEKFFENPMFGTNLPSTSSGSDPLHKEPEEEATELQNYNKELQEDGMEEVENLD